MTIHHHLDDSTILAHAAGTLDEAFSVAAACHVAWCRQCRAAVRRAESLGGEILTGIEPTNVSDECRATTMGLIVQATVHRFPNAARPVGDLPAPLARLLDGASLETIKWKAKAPGVAFHDLKLSPSAKGKLRLMRIGAGRSMPEHGHGGEEITLIISGAYRDHMGLFAKGDVADLDPEIEHKPVVETGEACICLVATEAATRFKSWPARLLQPFIGI